MPITNFMIKYLKLYSFKTYLIAGITFLAIISCEKDTGDLGLNTLPPQDGLSVHYDSVKIVNYTIVPDDSINTNQPNVKLFGSVIDTIGENTVDTVICNLEVPLYFYQFHSFDSSDYIYSIRLYYGFGEYAYGNFEDNTLECYVGEIGATEGTYIDTITLTLDTSSNVNTFFNHKISGELYDRIETGAREIVNAGYERDEYGYSDEVALEVKNRFHDNYFKGLTFTVKDPQNSFITRLISPQIKILHGADTVAPSDSVGQEVLALRSPGINDDISLEIPESKYSHSATITDSEGFLVQGTLGHKTIIDLAPMFNWEDSTRYNFNKAKITFNIQEGSNSKAPIDSLLLKIRNLETESEEYALAKLQDNSYTFYVHDQLNSIIARNEKISSLVMEIYCLNNNAKANKSLLQFKEGNYLYLTYTKY